MNSACKGTRTDDGGDSRLHPTDHRRRRLHQAAAQGGRSAAAAATDGAAAGAATAAARHPSCRRAGARAGDAAGRHRRDALQSQRSGAAPAPVEEPPAPDILELTESMATARSPQPANGGFRTIDGQSDVVFEERPLEETGAGRHARSARAVLEQRSADLGGDHRGGRFRVQHACPHRAGAERPHARGSGARDAAPDAQDAGSTTTCRGWSSGWCAPRSSACRADGPDASRRAEFARKPQRQRRQHDPCHDQQRHRAGTVEHDRAQADADRLPDIDGGGEQREAGRARLRRHLRAAGLQRVVQRVEAEPVERRPRAARATRPARSPARDSRRRTSCAPPIASPRCPNRFTSCCTVAA